MLNMILSNLPSTEHEVSSDESAVEDTSIPLMDDQWFRDFLQARVGYLSTEDFRAIFQRATAEMNRRLARQQAKLFTAQNVQLEAQERLNKAQLEAAQSLKRATWVLSIATVLLAIATAVPVLHAVVSLLDK